MQNRTLQQQERRPRGRRRIRLTLLQLIKLVVLEVDGGLSRRLESHTRRRRRWSRSSTLPGTGNQDRSGNKTEHSLSPEQEPDSEAERSKKSGSFSSSSADIEGLAPETQTESVAWSNRRNGIGGRGSSRRLKGGTLASHMPRLTATTSDTIHRTVLKAMTRRAAHQEVVRLAFIPQTNIITGDANWRRQVLGHTSTFQNTGNKRVGLRSQRMDDPITAKEDFDWFIWDLARKITHVNQLGTGIGRNERLAPRKLIPRASAASHWAGSQYVICCNKDVYMK